MHRVVFPGLNCPQTLRKQDKPACWNGGGPTRSHISIWNKSDLHRPSSPLPSPAKDAPVLQGEAHSWARPGTPKERQCQSGFQVYCWHAHSDGTHYSRRSTSKSAGAGRERVHWVTPCPLGTAGPSRDRGLLLTTEDQTRQRLPQRPEGGFKNGLLTTLPARATGRDGPRRCII